MTHTTTATEPTTTTPNCIELLCNFVDARPGLDPMEYGGGLEGRRIYRRESAEITRDRSDFYILLNVALRLYDREELNTAIFNRLTNIGDRLTLEKINGEYKLQYITGQYYPTEYRPACCRVIVSVIWQYYQRKEELQTGHDIRREIRKRVDSRRVNNLYFN